MHNIVKLKTPLSNSVKLMKSVLRGYAQSIKTNDHAKMQQHLNFLLKSSALGRSSKARRSPLRQALFPYREL